MNPTTIQVEHPAGMDVSAILNALLIAFKIGEQVLPIVIQFVPLFGGSMDAAAVQGVKITVIPASQT